MKQYVIDTNALLSFVTDRNTAQQAVMTGVFELVTAAQATMLCPQFGDAVIAACARSAKGASVITFDRRFMRKLASRRIPFMDSKSR